MAAGGFDVVLGNPPWERIKLQEQEFFAARDPEIAQAPNAAARRGMIAALESAEEGTRERTLYEAFETAKRAAEALSVFARLQVEDGGRFPLTARGDINTYALFGELFASIVSKCGRAGVILPSGLATDNTTKDFFSALIFDRRLHSFFEFENEGFFAGAGQGHMVRFALTTVLGPKQENQTPRFLFQGRSITELDDERRIFTLSAEDIARVNPNTKTAPIFRGKAEAELTARIYGRVPVLIDERKGKDGNPWDVSFMAMFHMSNDSGLFRIAAQLIEAGFVRDGSDWVRRQSVVVTCQPESATGPTAYSRLLPAGRERYVPLYEAKMIYLYNHRHGSFGGVEKGERVHKLPPIDLGRLQSPDFEVVPHYWVPEEEVETRIGQIGWLHGWFLGWRDVTDARASARSTIFSTVPKCGVGNSLPLLLSRTLPASVSALLANLSSIVLDFLARFKIAGLHLNFFVLEQLPVLPPSFYTPADLAFIVPRVLELTYTSYSMAPFARDLGYDGPPFAWDEDRRALLRAELDAFYARAYGLSRDELRYILDPTDVKGPDYPSETFRVLKSNEIRRFGEYRTARLVLQAWDRMERGELLAGSSKALTTAS